MMKKKKSKLNQIEVFLQKLVPDYKNGIDREFYDASKHKFNVYVKSFMQELEDSVDATLLDTIHSLAEKLFMLKINDENLYMYRYEMTLMHLGGGIFCRNEVNHSIKVLNNTITGHLREQLNTMIIFFKQNEEDNQNIVCHYMMCMDEQNDPKYEKLKFLLQNQNALHLPENIYEYYLVQLGAIIYGATNSFHMLGY